MRGITKKQGLIAALVIIPIGTAVAFLPRVLKTRKLKRYTSPN